MRFDLVRRTSPPRPLKCPTERQYRSMSLILLPCATLCLPFPVRHPRRDPPVTMLLLRALPFRHWQYSPATKGYVRHEQVVAIMSCHCRLFLIHLFSMCVAPFVLACFVLCACASVLDYEAALTRRHSDGLYYNMGAHFLWIGDRTRHMYTAFVSGFVSRWFISLVIAFLSVGGWVGVRVCVCVCFFVCVCVCLCES
jgi:hypothetical protein